MKEALSERPPGNPRQARRQAFWIVFVSMSLGPPIAGVMFGWTLGLVTAATSSNSLDPDVSLGLTIVWSPLFALGGYIFGVVPALGAGILLAVLNHRLSDKQNRTILATGSGAIMTILAVAVVACYKWSIGAVKYSPHLFTVLAIVCVAAVLGGVTSWCCARVLVALGVDEPRDDAKASVVNKLTEHQPS